MITFNTLLHDEQIDPKDVKLARHQDKRHPGRPTPYEIWRGGGGQLELYQSIQSRTVFNKARMVASFVATPLNETLFVGLYLIAGLGKAPAGLIDPISNEDIGGHHLYKLEPLPALAGYCGRLVINWGGGYRAWVQSAKKLAKPIVEIRRTAGDPPFPGFLNFCRNLSSLVAVPLPWREALSSVTGVYLLTDPKNGKQYVGSANGSAGFWGRWEDYVASGHGGNRRMREVPAADYQVTILEVASSSTRIDDLIEMEGRWKEKLLSRRFGLNGN